MYFLLGIIQEEDISDNPTLDDRNTKELFNDDDDDDDGSLLTPMFKHKLNGDLLEPEPDSSLPAVYLKQMEPVTNKPKKRRKQRVSRKPSLRENLVKEYFKNSPLLAIPKKSKLLTEQTDNEYFEFRIKVERGKVFFYYSSQR